ncbi:uncharacterized protein LOC142849326 isoform X2 [Microtus pennsylvanicus]
MELLSTKTRTPGSPMIRGQKEEQNGAGRAVSRRAQDTLPHKLKICSVLYSVCKKEGLALPSKLAHRLAEKSCRNLRKALLMCEACRVQQYPFTEDQEIPEKDWEVCLRETANSTVSQQTPQRKQQNVLASAVPVCSPGCSAAPPVPRDSPAVFVHPEAHGSWSPTGATAS